MYFSMNIKKDTASALVAENRYLVGKVLYFNSI